MSSGDPRARLHHATRPGHRMVVVDPRGADQRATAQVEDRERRAAQLAAYDDLVPRQAGADVLQVQVVLVGPEPGHLGVWGRAAGHRPARREPLALRGLEVLDPNPGLEQRMEE